MSQSPIKFPNAFDDETTLFTVTDDAVTRLAEDWRPEHTELVLEDTNRFPASGGYCTVYSFHDSISVAKRVTTFKFSGVSDDRLTGVVPINNPQMPRVKGCRVVLNIMAQHRNATTNANLAMQKVLGEIGTQDESTIEWFANLLTSKVKVPRPFFSVSPSRTGFKLTTFNFKDQTYRLQPWQDIKWEWDFGDGTTSTEQNPSHAYEYPGLYTVMLRVTNNYGDKTLIARDVIRVLGEVPRTGDISVVPTTLIAGETFAVLSFQPSPIQDEANPIENIEWEIEGRDSPLIGTTVRALFQTPGRMSPRVFQRTRLGNYSIQQGPEINVIERNSAWLIIQPSLNPEFTIEEYMPSLDSYKTGKGKFVFERDWQQVKNKEVPEENFLFSGGLHRFQGRHSALYLANRNLNIMRFRELGLDTDVATEGGSRSRGWGWTSARIITTEVDDPLENDQVYVFFGRATDDERQRELLTVEHYGMNTKTWESMPLASVAASLDDEDIIRNAAHGAMGSRGRRWRSTNWQDKIYILGSDDRNYMSRFVSFQPATQSWSTLSMPLVSGRTLDLVEATLFSLSEGVYMAGVDRFISKYSPNDNAWTSLVGSSAWAVSSSGVTADSRTPIKAFSSEESPKVDNTRAYVSGYATDSFASYDEISRSATSHRFRPAGLLNAGGVI